MEAFDIDINTNTPAGVPAPAEHTNPFDTNTGGSNPFEADFSPPAVSPQKAAAAAGLLLLDLDSSKEDPFQAPPFNNGHANANGNLYDFLEHPPNGKVAPANAESAAEDEDGDEDLEDDSGAENAGDGGIVGAAGALPGKNPFGADLELQRQQLSEFDRENEPRRDTPTPPADEVPGVIGLVSDNVAESGEESEDEWNYYRVDPTEKEPQTKQEVCEEPPLKVEETDENMESQLNPNAAEFIPSPTHSKQSIEEILSQAQAIESDSLIDKSSGSNTIDLAATQEKEVDKKENELSSSQKEDLVNPLTVESCLNEESFGKRTSGGLNESATFSTHDVFGEETAADTGLQKILDTSSNIMETSLMEQDFNASEEQTGPETTLEKSVEPKIVEQETVLQQDTVNDFQKEPVHISFELQKEIAPHMESQPERVKVDSEDQSPIQESEPDFQAAGDFSENKNVSEDLQFVHDNEISNQPSVFEDFIAGSKAGLEDSEVEVARIIDDVTANIEDTVNFDHAESEVLVEQLGSDAKFSVDNLVELSKPLEFSEDIESSAADLKVFAESPANFIQNQVVQLENNVEVPSQLSESPLSELTGELSVHQESQNHLSNEISTPEYEKFEKDFEASEKCQDKISDAEISSEFTQFSKSNVDFSADVLLESAHPDTEELLNDACTETLADVPSTEIPLKDDFAPFENLTTNIASPGPELLEPASSEFVCSDADLKSATPITFAQSDVGLLNESAIEENIVSSPTVDPAPLDSEILPRTQLNEQMMETVSADNTSEQQLIQSNVTDELENVKSVFDSCTNIPSHKVENSDIALELLESTEVPPPTPSIIQLEGELLDFSSGSNNFSQAVEKLSLNQQTSEVSGLEEVKEISSQFPVDVLLENSQQIVENLNSPTVDSEVAVPVAELAEPKISEVVAQEPSNDSTLALETTNEVKLEETESVKNDVAAGAVVAGVAVAAATVVTTAAVVAPSAKEVKKEKEVLAKKSTLSAKDKRLTSEKTQTPGKFPITSRLSAITTKSKSPTSPVKSVAATKTAPTRPASSMVPSKPLSRAPTKTASKPLTTAPTRTTPTSAATSRPKSSSTSARPSSTTVNLSKTRPISAPAEKKPLTNGDIKTAIKRPESSKAPTSKMSPSLSQSSTVRTATRTVSATSTVAKTKAPLNGPSKPRPLSSVTQVRTVAKASNEKDIKETANKQISTRTTSTVRSTTTTTASKTNVTSASRKIESKVITNGKGPAMKPSSMTKTTTTTTSRIAAKKPTTTTRLKSTKTDSIVEKSETVQSSTAVIEMQ